jgi:hypothetical protein
MMISSLEYVWACAVEKHAIPAHTKITTTQFFKGLLKVLLNSLE